jgi:hypothetical protein
MADERTFHIHDSSVIVWGAQPSPGSISREGGDWNTYTAVRKLLKRRGYTVGFDPETKARYKKIWKWHHAGRRKDVLFRSYIYTTGFEFKFYEDVIRDNKNGGEYHFDKMKKAHYLWRLSVELIHRKITALLERRGFRNVTTRPPETALEAVEQRQKSWMVSHPYIFKDLPYSYNATDEDGVLLLGGEVRYFRTRNGHLSRGVVWRGANNCWDLVQNRTEWTNEATFRLFTYDPKKHERKVSVDPLVNISRALEGAVRARNYLRADAIQKAIDRMATHHDFKAGDRVEVDNPRYQGPGIVESVRPPFWVLVKVGREGDGNTWRYEWATVRPADLVAAHESVER